MAEYDPTKDVIVNEQNFEVLVAKLIPTSEYFEGRFQLLQTQINGLQKGQDRIEAGMDLRFEQVGKQFDVVGKQFEQVDKRFEQVDKRFEQVDKQFEQVDKQFEQVDKRFEQVDKRFEQVDRRMDSLREGQKELKADFDKRFEQVDGRFQQVNDKLDTIINRLDVKIDAGLRENRSMSIRLFSFAMVFSAISMAGLLAKMTGLF